MLLLHTLVQPKRLAGLRQAEWAGIADDASSAGLGELAFTETKKQRPNTGARASNTLHK